MSRASPSRPPPDAEPWTAPYHRELYDLIVLDLMLPGEDGLAICRRLRGQGNPSRHHHAHRQRR